MGDVLVTRDSSRPRDGTGRVGYGTGRREALTLTNPYLLRAPVDVGSISGATHEEALALAIAAQQVKQLGELAHIDYDLCLDDPDVRAVVAEALRWAALRELER